MNYDLQSQVAATSLQLANKNKYLEFILKALKAPADIDLRWLSRDIKMNIDDTDHWSNFLCHFNLLHAGYMDRLIKEHPGLTLYEQRLCVLLRSGLLHKEIAQILSVECGSIKKARYRLKKKMRLCETQSLKMHLDSI